MILGRMAPGAGFERARCLGAFTHQVNTFDHSATPAPLCIGGI